MAQNLRHYRHYVISGASKADFTKDATSYDKISKGEHHPLYSIFCVLTGFEGRHFSHLLLLTLSSLRLLLRK